MKMKERRLIIKGKEATVLLNVSLPCDEEYAELSGLYEHIYTATVDAARIYADSCTKREGGFLTLDVSSSELRIKKRLEVKRSYILSYRGVRISEKTFTDVFDASSMKLIK